MQSDYAQVRRSAHAWITAQSSIRLLYDLKRDGRYRTFIDLERQVGALPTAIWRRGPTARNDSSPCGAAMTTLAWVSILTYSPPCTRTIAQTGGGTGGTRNISGHHHARMSCWRRNLAELHGKEAALVFTSGWISRSAQRSA